MMVLVEEWRCWWKSGGVGGVEGRGGGSRVEELVVEWKCFILPYGEIMNHNVVLPNIT